VREIFGLTPSILHKVRVAVPTPSGTVMKEVDIFADREPIDTIEEFRQKYALDKNLRHKILVQACQQPNVQCHREVPLVFSTRINDEQGQYLGHINIFEDQEPADIVAEFGLSHGLPRDHYRGILKHVCNTGKVTCTRVEALLYVQRIHDQNGKTLGTLNIYDHMEPVDQVYRFIVDHKLPFSAVPQVLQPVCEQISTCSRGYPMVFSRNIVSEGGAPVGNLEIPVDVEPADAVYNFCIEHQVGKEFRKVLVDTVCSDNYVKCKRRSPLVFASPIVMEEGVSLGVLEIQEDEEVADAIYHFWKEKNFTMDARINLFNTLCGRDRLTCTRGRAKIQSLPIAKDETTTIGVLDLYEGVEPADSIYEFAENYQLSDIERDNLIEKLCYGSSETQSPLTCNRLAPVVFSAPITANNGTSLGVMEILVGDEPADAIARFGNKHEMSDEEKANLLPKVCELSRLPCTRERGLLYHTTYTHKDGRVEPLYFFDGQDATDVIYDFAITRNISFRERRRYLIDTCSNSHGRLNCTRAEPMLLQIPVWESADKKLADLIVLEGQEPVDIVYAFLEKHDLFQTAPLNTTLLEVVCNSTRVVCNRMRPRRILFSMQATYAGLQHSLQYVRPEEDWHCFKKPRGGQKCIHYVEVLAKEFCERHMTEWSGCHDRIVEALKSQLETYEESIWRSKDHYAKLGLVKLATTEEIDAAYNRLVKRYNNETQPVKYEKLREAYRILSDPEEKYYYDLPCLKFFGLCGKRGKDGGISISMD
jgi:hypothetical protein